MKVHSPFIYLLLLSFLEQRLSILLLLAINAISLSVFKTIRPTLRLTALFFIFILTKYILELNLLQSMFTTLNSTLSHSLASQITDLFDTNHAQFLIGITIGGSNVDLNQDLKNLFKKFNLLHLISVSGANFILINELTNPLKKYLGYYRILITNLIVSSYYIFAIGFSNLPASRAFLFSSYDNIAALSGRPIKFFNKLLLSLCVISYSSPTLLFERSLILSVGFTLLYKSFGLPKIKTLFDNELLKLATIFIISATIFGNENPDFLANLLLSVIYPILFIGTFTIYITSIIGAELLADVTYRVINIILDFIFEYLGALSSTENTYLQTMLFLAILAIFVYKIVKNKYRGYQNIAQ